MDAVWNYRTGRAGMEEYRDNGRGKVQTSYDRLSDEALLRQLRAGDAAIMDYVLDKYKPCLLYTSPSPRDKRQSRMPSSA